MDTDGQKVETSLPEGRSIRSKCTEGRTWEQRGIQIVAGELVFRESLNAMSICQWGHRNLEALRT